MAAIETWLRQPAAQAIGWALLQFVWQGAAVGVLAALALAALRRSAADVRYVVSSIALALMLTLPVVTGVQKYQALRAATASEGAAGAVFENGVPATGDGLRALFDRMQLVDPAAATPPQRSASAMQTAYNRYGAIMPAFLVRIAGVIC